VIDPRVPLLTHLAVGLQKAAAVAEGVAADDTFAVGVAARSVVESAAEGPLLESGVVPPPFA